MINNIKFFKVYNNISGFETLVSQNPDAIIYFENQSTGVHKIYAGGITYNIVDIQEFNNVKSKVNTIQGQVNVLNADKDTQGSVDYKINNVFTETITSQANALNEWGDRFDSYVTEQNHRYDDIVQQLQEIIGEAGND